MRGKAISWRFLTYGSNLLVCLLLMVLAVGCKDKTEEVGREQQKKDVASKEQKQGAGTTAERTVELTLPLAKASESAQKHQLLPKAAERTNTDATPRYEKAPQALPNNFQKEQISQWLKPTLKKLPHKQLQTYHYDSITPIKGYKGVLYMEHGRSIRGIGGKKRLLKPIESVTIFLNR